MGVCCVVEVRWRKQFRKVAFVFSEIDGVNAVYAENCEVFVQQISSYCLCEFIEL